jgi:hypothetical protein
MPQRASAKQAAPAEVLGNLSQGYNGYTDPTLTNPKMWANPSVNCFSGAFGFIQRCRFANVVNPSPLTGVNFTSLKYFALPGVGSYLLADINGKLYSYDTGLNYFQTQRLNPYVDPAGTGSSQLNGPWSRETLGNITYEMNGQVKQAGRLANAATIEGWGLDAPDASPQVVIRAATSQGITSVTRSNGVVTATLSGPYNLILGFPGGVTNLIFNVTGVTDPSFNGSFTLVSGNGTATFVWNQLGQNVTSSGGTVNNSITKAVGRSYAYAWENANKSHVGAPSPATQFILYANQNGEIQCLEPGTITTGGTPVVTGTGTFFTPAWIGRHIWVNVNADIGRIVSVQSATQLTLAATPTGGSGAFQVFDPQATHIRLYATADGGATYFRIQRNVWNSAGNTQTLAGLEFFDLANAEPPNFPFTTELAQTNNVPPPVGQFVNEYQGRLCVFGVAGALQSFFYSNQETTTLGLPQESFAPLNQVTLPIQNAKLNGMIEFPGSAILWSDKQDMFRLTGLLVDNTVSGVATSNAAAQQGASIARLPYALGCASPFAAEITPLGGIWLTSNAEVWLFTDRYAPRNIGKPVQDILNSVSAANLSLARMKYYHTNTRNWLALCVAANSATYNNTVLVLDLDLLASNGSPSYFTFDMATNSPAWWVFQPGTVQGGNWFPRCDSIETVYETAGLVRLLVGQTDLIQDIDYSQGGFGTEIQVPNGQLTTHAYGNDSAFVIKRPGWVRFNTNRDPSMLATDGWSFAIEGIDDDFYTFFNPLTLALTPGVNDSSTLGGNPDFAGGLAFRHSPELYKVGGVNFVMGRRLKFQVNFPSGTGTFYQLRSIQVSFNNQPPN